MDCYNHIISRKTYFVLETKSHFPQKHLFPVRVLASSVGQFPKKYC